MAGALADGAGAVDPGGADPELRPVLFEVIQEKSGRLDCQLRAVNAVEDHVLESWGAPEEP